MTVSRIGMLVRHSKKEVGLFGSVATRLAAVPKTWFIPQKDRAILAIIGTVFWAATIWQAGHVATRGASVFSLFGLGLLYLIFSIINLYGALIRTIAQPIAGKVDESQARALAQLFVVLVGMAVCNVIVLVLYLWRGASFTRVDSASVVLDSLLLLLVVSVYGASNMLSHPVARGWLAVAGKTVPQLVTAWLFWHQPSAAYGLALVTLLGIDVLSALRFWPTLRAFLRDRHSLHLRGLLLGEGGNTLSGLLLTMAWLLAHLH